MIIPLYMIGQCRAFGMSDVNVRSCPFGSALFPFGFLFFSSLSFRIWNEGVKQMCLFLDCRTQSYSSVG